MSARISSYNGHSSAKCLPISLSHPGPFLRRQYNNTNRAKNTDKIITIVYQAPLFVINSERLIVEFLWDYKKRCTRLAAASDKVYQLLAHGRWYSSGTLASSTTKTCHHDIVEILLNIVKHQKAIKSIFVKHYEKLEVFFSSNKYIIFAFVINTNIF
jgi:hypothetical protein